MTTFLILCWTPFCCQNSPDPSRHGLRSTWMAGPKVSQQNIAQSITLPPPACLLPIVRPGAMCSPGKWHTRTRPSTWCKREYDSSDHATFFHCSVVQFWCPTVRLLDRTTRASLRSPRASMSLGRPWPCRRFTTVPSLDHFDRYWPLQTGNTPQELQFWRCSDAPVV